MYPHPTMVVQVTAQYHATCAWSWGGRIGVPAFRRASAAHAPRERHSGRLSSLCVVLPRPLRDLAERERGLHLVEGGLHEALQFCASRVAARGRE